MNPPARHPPVARTAFRQLMKRLREVMSDIFEAWAMATAWLEEDEAYPSIDARREPGGRRRTGGMTGSRAPRASKHRRAGRSLGQLG